MAHLSNHDKFVKIKKNARININTMDYLNKHGNITRVSRKINICLKFAEWI
jgi:hypothetical protein